MKRLLFPALLAAVVAAAPASAQDWAKARLEKSPRHLEFVSVKHGDRTVKCFVGFPEVKTKATAVVLIHEIFGLSDWMRGMVDQFAEAGYIAIAPDFLSGAGPNGGGTESLGSGDGVRSKIQGLAQTQIDADLDAAVAYVKKLDACNGKVVVGGFCWGGAKTFLYAVHNPNIQAGLSFYGTPAKAEDMPKIKAPIHGFYAENDARINAGLPAATEGMKAAGKFYEPITYKGAGHGFMRAGEDPAGSPDNKQARADAWVRIKAILAKL
ncbi:MAG: dienelactone hydrolase family protein [Verrucomicrobia bacterium]|nr:dienelactone hydrolase family protein [Verrucomicrobiota bacterium]